MALPEQSGTNDALNAATAIKAALERDKTFSSQAQQITVITTDDRQVFLIGTVISDDERKKVEDAARPYLDGYQLIDQLVIGH